MQNADTVWTKLNIFNFSFLFTTFKHKYTSTAHVVVNFPFGLPFFWYIHICVILFVQATSCNERNAFLVALRMYIIQSVINLLYIQSAFTWGHKSTTVTLVFWDAVYIWSHAANLWAGNVSLQLWKFSHPDGVTGWK